MLNFENVFAFTAMFLAFYLALSELLVRQPRSGPLFTVTMLTIGVFELHMALVLSDQLRDYPWLFTVQLPAIYLFGPSTYLIGRQYIRREPIQRRDIVHFLLPAISLAAFFWHQLLPVEEQLARIAASRTHPLNEWSGYLLMLGLALLCSYLISSLYIARHSLRNMGTTAWDSPMLVWLVIMTCFCLLIVFVAILAALSGNQSFYYLRTVLSATGMFAMLLLYTRYPGFVREALGRVTQRSNRIERARRLDELLIEPRLKKLIEQEQVYRIESLSLEDLAVMIGCRSYQLSAYINLYEGVNFRSYINRLRVAAAAEMLRQAEDDRSILTIAFDVGFNSKASFNRAFRQEMKINPREFRRLDLDSSAVVEGGPESPGSAQ